jgi:hypothetical protein
MSRFLALACVALALCGCGEVKNADDAIAGLVTNQHGLDSNVHVFDGTMKAVTLFGIVDVVSLANTHKTIDDHLVSLISGKDCSTIKAAQGYPYCVDIPVPGPVTVQTTYCYKSIASVSCYDRPLPFDTARFTASRTDDIPLPQ